jgi:hypothetical protein
LQGGTRHVQAPRKAFAEVFILMYDQNRFIRSQIRKRLKEVKNPYQRRRVIAAVGH